jgi:hypothetical protein
MGSKRERVEKIKPLKRRKGPPDAWFYNARVIMTPQGQDTPGIPLGSNYSRKLDLMVRCFREAFDHYSWAGPIRADVVLLILAHWWMKGEYQLRTHVFRAVDIASHSIDLEVDEECFDILFHRVAKGGISLHDSLYSNIHRVWTETPKPARQRLPFSIDNCAATCNAKLIDITQLSGVEYWSLMVRAYVHGEFGLVKRSEGIPPFPKDKTHKLTRSAKKSGRISSFKQRQYGTVTGNSFFYPNKSFSSIACAGSQIRLTPEVAKTIRFMTEQYRQDRTNSFSTSCIDSALNRCKRKTYDTLRKARQVWKAIVGYDGRGRVKFLILPDLNSETSRLDSVT